MFGKKRAVELNLSPKNQKSQKFLDCICSPTQKSGKKPFDKSLDYKSIPTLHIIIILWKRDNIYVKHTDENVLNQNIIIIVNKKRIIYINIGRWVI